MNLTRLREAEATFFAQYPEGFGDPGLAEIGKRHKVDKVVAQAQELLSKKAFKQTSVALDNLVKIVTRSSMVSLFEKPKFRDYVNGMSRDDREYLATGFHKLLHGNQQKGFEQVLDVLVEGKLAKWSLMTIALLYLRPNEEVFVKPTTTKAVLRHFEIEDLVYHPRPTWAFYAGYRDLIADMKSQVDPRLSPNNAAFTGFLMMTTGTSPNQR